MVKAKDKIPMDPGGFDYSVQGSVTCGWCETSTPLEHDEWDMAGNWHAAGCTFVEGVMATRRSELTAVELQGRVVELELRESGLRGALEARVVRRLITGSSRCDECDEYYQGAPLPQGDPDWRGMPADKHKDTCPLWKPADEHSFTGF